MNKYTAKVTTETEEVSGHEVKYITFKNVTDVETNEVVLPEYTTSDAELPPLKALEDGDKVLMDADISTLMMFLPDKNSASKNQFTFIENIYSLVVTERKMK